MIPTPPPLVAGSCFGFSVRSTLPFGYLRQGSGEGEALEVVERDEDAPLPEPQTDNLLVAWTPTPARPFHARLYGGAGRFDYWVEGAGWFEVDTRAGRIVVPTTATPVRREERIWGVPALLGFTERGDVPLHAAAIEIDGGAVLVSAPGRYGKTTLAGAFVAAGHRLLSEDISCCRPLDAPAVIPGPAMLRVRRDVHERMPFPGTRVLDEDDIRVHLAIDEHLRGDSSPVPIRGIFFLRPGAERCGLYRVDPTVALPDLWLQSFRLPFDEERARRFRDLADLASRVPLWNLDRPEGLDRLPEVVERVTEACRRA